MRRNYKKKVKVLKDYGYLRAGDILESVTLRKGQYTGMRRESKNELTKHSIPIHHAEEIK